VGGEVEWYADREYAALDDGKGWQENAGEMQAALAFVVTIDLALSGAGGHCFAHGGSLLRLAGMLILQHFA
jgi:hypothetical protein